ncbi:MAG: thioredoxin family protein [Puniceicoccales bacterium]|nr:thioredoxin family protein [Puniceicoccales bacterium]
MFFSTATLASTGAGVASRSETKAPSVPAEEDSGAPIDHETTFVVIDWLTDMEEARALASQTGRDILVAFVGSDHSIWSGRLETEVFSHPAFVASVNKHFVCVLIDDPRTYRLPEDEERKNTALRQAWRVQTNPTVFLADETGRPYAVTGYRSISAPEYANHLLTLRTIHEQRDRFFASAKAAGSDTERAVMFSRALREMDETIVRFHYRNELMELRKIDPKDSTGLIGDIEFVPRITQLRNHVLRLVRQKKYQNATDAVDTFIRRNAPSGEHLQRVLFLKLPVHAAFGVRDHEAILRLMDTIIAINAETEHGKMAVEVKANANALIETERKKAVNEKAARKGKEKSPPKETSKSPVKPPAKTPPAPPPAKTPPAKSSAK